MPLTNRLTEKKMSMKVLLIVTDLYKAVGGGQTVYKKIIEATPDVDFFYFREKESAYAPRPFNAHAIALKIPVKMKSLLEPIYPLYKKQALERACRFAQSASGQSFDVIDVPDFHVFGKMLRLALDCHHVKVNQITLALHGNISISKEMNWGACENHEMELRLLEQEQFNDADSVYAISARYASEWKSIIDRDIHYIDPAHFITSTIRQYEYANPPVKPSIYCIGRSERRKGNDLFIELARWLRPGSFNKAAHVGDCDYSNKGISSSYLLQNIAKARSIEIDYLPSMDSTHLGELYSQPSIIILPVRYDTLNLVALEALFSGCPVAVSSRAGVCDYLDTMHPELPYIKIDFDNFYGAVPLVQDLIDRYDYHRQKLLAYLKKHPTHPLNPFDIKQIYDSIELQQKKEPLSKTADPFKLNHIWKKTISLTILKRVLPYKSISFIRHLKFIFANIDIKKTKSANLFFIIKLIHLFSDSAIITKKFLAISNYPQKNIQQLRKKLNKIYDYSKSPLFRCNFWKEIARIERILGNESIAVAYELRILRLLGQNHLNLLPNTINTLNKLGFVHEAKAAQAMYGDPDNAEKNIYAYLKESYQKNLIRKNNPFELLSDWRTVLQPKVSVIISLYNAEAKLHFFLTALCAQTLIKKNDVEIILIDSGSPTNERKIAEDFFKKTGFNAIYARSTKRETIQAAWNRGIGLARGSYLVFLGADEMLYPEGLEVLANQLDANPKTDWVMANSLLTEVETTGVYKNDVMVYDRKGGTKNHVYLETCYLSWVGGMYRKTVHERFGYYDETFSAAGDTEFKNRILPYINVSFIPQTLGLFLNYPEERTTASPKAEIEDLRAWYIHRTPAGVRYAFENRPEKEIEELLCFALGYRKSFCQHLSSDIEYACYLTKYLKMRNPNSHIANCIESELNCMLKQQQKLELTHKLPKKPGILFQLIKTKLTATYYQRRHRKALDTALPTYSVFNDNRYEQHSWLWKS